MENVCHGSGFGHPAIIQERRNFRAIKKRELYLIHPRGPRKAHTN